MMLNRKNVVITLFTYLSILLIPAASIQAAQVHAIIVADTFSGTSGMETNIDLMHREAKRVAALIDLPLHIAIFEHYEVRLENLLNYIQKLEVESDDIILFYINNHGSRLIDKINKWPDLLFYCNQAFTPNNYKIDFHELNGILKNKNPKFLLSIADSCNEIVNNDQNDWEDSDNDLDNDQDGVANAEDYENLLQNFLSTLSEGPTGEYFLSEKDSFLERIRELTDDEEMELYRNLFLEVNGNIMISSSSPGEYAHSEIFTSSFLKTMRNNYILRELNSNPGWKEIFLETGKDVHKKFQALEGLLHDLQGSQTIQYELMIF